MSKRKTLKRLPDKIKLIVTSKDAQKAGDFLGTPFCAVDWAAIRQLNLDRKKVKPSESVYEFKLHLMKGSYIQEAIQYNHRTFDAEEFDLLKSGQKKQSVLILTKQNYYYQNETNHSW